MKSGGGGHSKAGGRRQMQKTPGRAVLQPSRGRRQHNRNSNHKHSTHSSSVKLNTLLVDKPSLDLRLKVDSGAGASVIPIGCSQEPIQSDAMTGRTYFTANGEK
eukprot:1056253-Amphidinium_carterae.1